MKRLPLLLLLAAPLCAETLTITVREAPPTATAYVESNNIVGRCTVGATVREMVLPRSENVFALTVGEGPEASQPFSCTVSKRASNGSPLSSGVYRIQCAANGDLCLDWHRCTGSTCVAE